MKANRQCDIARATKAGPVGSLNTACSLLLLLIFLILAPPAGWAQSADPNPDVDVGDEQSSSEYVEESEEAYRRRMELEEANDGAEIIIDRSSGTLKVPVGMDALPYESRKHLRDELRSVIIENGEWQAEDAQASYPYTPSAAAEKDPELRKQEEEAWGELVSEYHEREAAALAGGGRSGQPGGGQGGGQGQGQGQGQQGSGSRGSGSPASEPPQASQAGSSAAGAGVSQSALEFLKGKQGGPGTGSGSPGQPGSPGQAGSSEQATATGEMASASTSAPTESAGQQESHGEASPDQLALNDQGQEQQGQQEQAQNAKEAMEKKNQESSSDSTPPPPPPPGSIAIGELAALNEGASRPEDQEEPAEVALGSSQESDQANERASSNSDSDSDSGENSDNEAEAQPPPTPGTIAIPELDKLKGMEDEDADA